MMNKNSPCPEKAKCVAWYDLSRVMVNMTEMLYRCCLSVHITGFSTTFNYNIVIVVNGLTIWKCRILAFFDKFKHKYEENSNIQTCCQKFKHGGKKFKHGRPLCLKTLWGTLHTFNFLYTVKFICHKTHLQKWQHYIYICRCVRS